MRKLTVLYIAIIFIVSCNVKSEKPIKEVKKDTIIKIEVDSFLLKNKIIIGTYLGNEKRNYYGNYAPDTLEVLWKLALGDGKTKVGRDTLHWYGTEIMLTTAINLLFYKGADKDLIIHSDKKRFPVLELYHIIQVKSSGY